MVNILFVVTAGIAIAGWPGYSVALDQGEYPRKDKDAVCYKDEELKEGLGYIEKTVKNDLS